MPIAFDTSALRKMLNPDLEERTEVRTAAQDALNLCGKLRDEGQTLTVPTPVVAELCAWVDLTRDDRLEMLERIAAVFNVAPFTEGAGQLAGMITADWKRKQKQTGATSSVEHHRDLCKTDHMILGVSIEHGCEFLVTENVRDFALTLPPDVAALKPTIVELADFVTKLSGRQRSMDFSG
jgi:predicted nucleic acid-binding protein